MSKKALRKENEEIRIQVDSLADQVFTLEDKLLEKDEEVSTLKAANERLQLRLIDISKAISAKNPIDWYCQRIDDLEATSKVEGVSLTSFVQKQNKNMSKEIRELRAELYGLDLKNPDEEATVALISKGLRYDSLMSDYQKVMGEHEYLTREIVQMQVSCRTILRYADKDEELENEKVVKVVS